MRRAAWSSALVLGLCGGLAASVAPSGGTRAAASPSPATRALRPHVRWHPIPYPAGRRADMAAYAKRHYGRRTFRLSRPRVIVEHIAVTRDPQAVWNTFAPNRRDAELGELPGLCTHFVVDGRGRIQQLVPLRLMCRHTVGLNDTAIGIEHTGYSDGDLLGNRRQLRASLRLTRWLRCSRGIRLRNVIGHNESLRSPYHHERVRRLRRQTHGDMSRGSMRRYRRKLRARPCPAAPARAARDYGTARRVLLGRSSKGRPIRAFRVGDRSSPRKALVVGSIHGNEPEGLSVTDALRGLHPRGVDLWVVPTVNPDGLRANRRQNARGVDLNRNFSYRWRRDGRRGSSYYSGPRPFSEPETRAVRRLILRLRPQITIWFHQPWGFVVLPEHGGRAERRYARLARFPAEHLRGARARLRGTATSWQKHVVRRGTAFVVELPARALSPREVRRHARAARRLAQGPPVRATHAGCGYVHRTPGAGRPGVAPLAIGDSVMLGAAWKLSHRGFEADTQCARSPRGGLDVIRRRRRAGTLPEIVVVALGTNAFISRSDVGRMLRAVGRRRTLMLVTPFRRWHPVGSGPMRRAARRHPGRITLIDWSRRARANRQWFWPDGTHLRDSGELAYSRLLQRAAWSRQRAVFGRG
jgi:hypothetical protein